MDGANAVVTIWCCDDFQVDPLHKIHGKVGGCEGSGVIWVADLPRSKLLIV